MKVLHIITRMNTGGPAVFLDHLTNAMNDLGTQSTIAYGYCESNEADYTQTHKISDTCFCGNFCWLLCSNSLDEIL